MNSLYRILILSLVAGTLSLGANKLASKKAALQAAKDQAKESAHQPVANSGAHELTAVDEDILDQLLFIATKYEPTLVWEGQSCEAKKTIVMNLEPKTKEQVFEHIVHRMLDNQVNYPFVVPQGTDYSQMDTFFLLITSLMCHDQELCKKLHTCIGETDILKLGKKLDGCLERTPEPIQNMLSPKKLGWQEKIKLANKINWRIKTKADPHAPQMRRA